MNDDDIVLLIDEQISTAIEVRKKEVKKQFKIWSLAISTVFGGLLFFFSGDEVLERVRNTILPTDHIVKNLTDGASGSKSLRRDIMGELEGPKLAEYPGVVASLEKNVWTTFTNADSDKIKNLLSRSKLDEEIINSYYKKLNQVIFDPEPVQESERTAKIKEVGSRPQVVRVGVFENSSNALTNCQLPFKKNDKRVILYFPPSTKRADGTSLFPFYKCPENYPNIILTLNIDGKSVSGIRLVGVERPIKEDNIEGVRARVTEKVALEFKEKGVVLGKEVMVGSASIEDVFD